MSALRRGERDSALVPTENSIRLRPSVFELSGWRPRESQRNLRRPRSAAFEPSLRVMERARPRSSGAAGGHLI